MYRVVPQTKKEGNAKRCFGLGIGHAIMMQYVVSSQSCMKLLQQLNAVDHTIYTLAPD